MKWNENSLPNPFLLAVVYFHQLFAFPSAFSRFAVVGVFLSAWGIAVPPVEENSNLRCSVAWHGDMKCVQISLCFLDMFAMKDADFQYRWNVWKWNIQYRI